MSRQYPAIPAECWECPLSDCYPTHPRCPVLRRELQEKGFPLPEITDPLQQAPKRGRPKKPQVSVGPVEDRREYQRKYQREYQRRKRAKARLATLKGVRITGADLEILEGICAREGRSLAQEMSTLLEIMAERARVRRS